MKITTCRGCGAPIVWIKTPAGKSMPCDASPVLYIKGGPDKIVRANGEVVAGVIIKDGLPDLGAVDGVGYVPHWSTCPKADSFRKGVKECAKH